MTITKSIAIRDKLIRSFKELNDRIIDSNGIVVSGHINPDGDNLGSQLALIEYLESIGKRCISLNEEKVPEILEFLPGSRKIRSIREMKNELYDFDMLIVVDSGELERIGEVRRFLPEKIFIANLDHHQANDRFGDMNIIDTTVSSIGELLYYFFVVNSIEITKTIAVNLYISIVTDSGSFKYDQTQAATHLIASKLLDYGVIPCDYTAYLYQNKDAGYLKLIELLLGRIKFFDEGSITFSYLTYDDMSDANCFDTEGLIDYLGIVRTVKIFVLIKEKEKEKYSVSMRSKNEINVSDISSKFGGGGHHRAAGFRADGMSVDELIASVLREIELQTVH